MGLRTPESILQTELKPMCAICKKEVDTIEAFIDFKLNEHIFIARCHGQVEMVTMPKEFAIDHKIERGIAFLDEMKQLTETKKIGG